MYLAVENLRENIKYIIIIVTGIIINNNCIIIILPRFIFIFEAVLALIVKLGEVLEDNELDPMIFGNVYVHASGL